MEPTSIETRCGNCDTVVMGPYCHMCGQHIADPLRSVPDFVRGLAGDVLHLESRTVRTARDLLLRPGLLTAAYRAGARARYLQPIQLYLLAAALFFVVNSVRPVVQFDVAQREVTSYLGTVTAGGEMDPQQLADLRARGISLPLYAERFRSRVNSNLPTFLVGSVLLFTIACAVAYRRTGWPLVAHAVFVLHWISFYLLVMAFDVLWPRGGAWEILHAVIWIATLLWFAFALRRVHAQSWWRTALKALLLTFVFNVILAIWVASVILVSSRTI